MEERAFQVGGTAGAKVPQRKELGGLEEWEEPLGKGQDAGDQGQWGTQAPASLRFS